MCIVVDICDRADIFPPGWSANKRVGKVTRLSYPISRWPQLGPSPCACSAAVAVGGGSNAAARCMPPACCACSALACATRVSHAASLPMRLPLPLAPHHLYRPFARTKVRNSPPVKPRLVFSFHAACSSALQLRAQTSAVAAAARINQPAAADSAHAISHDDIVLVRGGCWHACL